MTLNKWPRRLALAGSIVIGISIAILWSVYPDVIKINDPGENNLLSIDEGESADVNLSKNNSYIIFRLNNVGVNCTITEYLTGTQVTIGSPNFLHVDRVGVNGEQYYPVGTFIPEGDGLFSVENTASADGDTLWIVDEYDVDDEDMSVLNLASGSCFGLICGICLLPISLFLWISNRKKGGQAGLMMQTPDGMLVPIAPTDGTIQQRVPTTDEIWRSVHGGETLDLTIQQQPPAEDEAPPPFADRPDPVDGLLRVVDEIETVDDSGPIEENLRDKLGLSDSDENEVENSERSWKSWDEG